MRCAGHSDTFRRSSASIPKVSAEELLEHFALLKGIARRARAKEVVEALLRQTNLWDVRKKKLGGYSGGMRQRFGVAVALLGDPKLIIVDEPTAGLDPAERVRFLNLLSELGENSVVILSTHIVEDVSELARAWQSSTSGEILLEAEPLRAVEDLRGQIWRRVVSREELPAVERDHAVISTKLLAGRTIAHVYSDGCTGRGLRAGGAGPRGRLLHGDGRPHRSPCPHSRIRNDKGDTEVFERSTKVAAIAALVFGIAARPVPGQAALIGPGAAFISGGVSQMATGDLDDRLAAQGYPTFGRKASTFLVSAHTESSRTGYCSASKDMDSLSEMKSTRVAVSD